MATRGNMRALFLVWALQRAKKEWGTKMKLLCEVFPKTG